MTIRYLLKVLHDRRKVADLKLSELVEELSCSHYPDDVIEDIEHEIDYYSSVVQFYDDVCDEIYNISVVKAVPNAK